MGGKKYNKDGTKKAAVAQTAAPSASGQQSSAKPSASGGSGQRLTVGEPAICQSLQDLAVTEPVPSVTKSEPKQQQHSGGSIRKDQQQERVTHERPPWHDELKGAKNWPPVVEERNRTRGPPQHHSKEQQSSIPSSPSTSVAHGGAIPKTPTTATSIAKKPTATAPQNLRTLRIPIKEPGTRGDQLGLIETNYLELNITKLVENVYKYDVEATIKRGPKKLNMAAFLEFQAEFLANEQGISYDWKKIAVATHKLDIGNEKAGGVQITHPDTGKILDCNVTIKPAKDGAVVPIKRGLMNYDRENIEEIMQILDIILKSVYNQHLDRGIRGGRSFFPTPIDAPPYLGDFAELRKGLFQSMTLGHDAGNRKILKPLLNVDVSNKAFPKPYNSLIDLLRDMEHEYSTQKRSYVIDPAKPLSADVMARLHAHLSGLELQYCSDGTNKTIRKYFELGPVPAHETFVIERNGKKAETTVQNYFDDELKRGILYRNLPCIRLGNKIKHISVPMEYFAILGNQIVNKKCTDKQTAAMITETALSTNDRKTNIKKLVDFIRYNQSDTLAAFGIKVNEENFVKVPARKLPAPDIKYSNGVAKPKTGQWRMQFGNKNMNFLEAAECSKWCILNTDSYLDAPKLDSFFRELCRVSQTNGMNLNSRPLETQYQCKPYEIGRHLKRMAEHKVDIVFCVIPPKSQNYTKIKQEAELEVGVLTQCITSDTILRRATGSTLSNILLKVNAKLNSKNHKLLPSPSAPILSNFDEEPVMFIGADVTHPAPGLANGGYSVAAVVASYDRHAFGYNYGSRPQIGEIIVDFQTFVKDALMFFLKQNHRLPSKIFYFRDGVSDSQFKQVMESEWNALLRACGEVKHGYDKTVKVTIIIVQKRHHTRFFPGQNKISEDRNNNVPAGTVVDTIITRPDEPQYYLCSHQAIKGVARPTKYCILLDDGQHSMDDLQALTYALCHMFSRTNRSVSYPAPTYNAHLAADRGKKLLTGKNLDIENLDTYEQPAVLISTSNPMFFV